MHAAGIATLSRNGARWQLLTTSGTGNGEEREGQVEIAIAGAGTLRFAVLRGRPIGRPLWLQPAANTPFGYATPVTLVRQPDGRWRGTIQPLAEPVTLAMRIWRVADGSLRGRIRNPEFGWNLGRTFVVQARDSAIELRDPATGAVRFVQPWRRAPGAIDFEFGTPFALTRQRDVDAPPVVSLARPALRADGWPTRSAHAAGMDTARLRGLLDTLVRADPFSDSTLLLHSLLIARRGRLVVEHYGHGFDASQLHDTRSAFKSIIGTMAGAAMLQGVPLSADSPVYAVLAPGTGDTTRRGIRLRHLLTHSTGLACDDDDDRSPGNEEVMQRQDSVRDWTRYLLALPVVHPPGVRYAYCSGTMHLAAAMVARSTGTWLPAFFERAIAAPLGISRYALNLTPTGEAYGGGGAQLTPRDLLKLGQLQLNGGVWNGRRILPRAWVEASIAHHIATPDSGSDGLAWHCFTIPAAGRTWAEYEASGNGGQMIMVVPQLQLVVVTTAGNYRRYGTWRRIREQVLPAIIEASVR